MNDRILVVEDSPTQAAAIAHGLKRGGYEAVVAPSADQALDLLTSDGFALVVSDIVMPGMDGFELCRRIRDDVSLQDVPVILLTSLRDPLDVVRALEAGADNFLAKPCEPEHLLGRVRMMLANRALRASGRSQMSIELSFLGRSFVISTERQQLLDLLVTTFEELVVSNGRLRANEQELADAQEQVAAQLHAVELERRRLSGLLDALPDGVLVADASGRVTDANRTALEVVNLSEADLVERRLEDVLERPELAGWEVRPHVLWDEGLGERTVVLLRAPASALSSRSSPPAGA